MGVRGGRPSLLAAGAALVLAVLALALVLVQVVLAPVLVALAKKRQCRGGLCRFYQTPPPPPPQHPPQLQLQFNADEV
jgi:hypothetical protein